MEVFFCEHAEEVDGGEVEELDCGEQEDADAEGGGMGLALVGCNGGSDGRGNGSHGCY